MDHIHDGLEFYCETRSRVLKQGGDGIEKPGRRSLWKEEMISVMRSGH